MGGRSRQRRRRQSGRGAAQPGPPARRKWYVGQRLAGACVLVLAVTCGAFSVPGLPRSFGLVGTTGTLTVQWCGTEGFGRSSHTVCHGPFRSDDGRTTDPLASIETEYTRGHRVPVTKSGGAYYSVTPSAWFGWLAGIFAAALFLCLGVPMALFGTLTDRRPRASWIVARGATVLLPAMLVCLAVSFVLDVAFS
ncbi:hypothetical protein [Streptomyces sp. UNOC14_S4]|uniref:hypothetical protein n=1 Tax=Streptomyces sp. UNOC14_S4 TaxID=2872340 RepID=UPI001E59DAE5|nr:hypothetical protein [Streptomyces sp. UNOC14_S4]MCC3767003.1 hypothetical protein [Streptomyces sp. UNOC14_S4]